MNIIAWLISFSFYKKKGFLLGLPTFNTWLVANVISVQVPDWVYTLW